MGVQVAGTSLGTAGSPASEESNSPLEDGSSPTLWETVGPRRRHGHGRRLTLAPAVNEVRAASLSPRDPLTNELPCVCGDADSNNTLRNDDVVRSQLNIEEAYHDCIMAGFTSEEAMDYIKAKENSLQK